MKILYLMHIDWNWIKQRPQYLAEALSESNDVRVYSIKAMKKRGCVNNKKSVKHKYLFRIPFSGRIKPFMSITKLVNRIYFSRIIKRFQPDIIWLCAPMMYNFIPKKYHSLIVYDCMDDHISFNNAKVEEIKSDEYYVCNNAKMILTSSLSLKEKIIKRYGIAEEKISVVRNAYNGKLQECNNSDFKHDNSFHLDYVGTISSWFDFDLIIKAMEDFPNIVVDLYGPCEIDKKIYEKYERLIFHGPIEHEQIYNYIKYCDALIMPFQLNELIKSVDPVKLYEYINFEKNIICVDYPEIRRFADFIHFYNNYSEFKDILNKLIKNNDLKYDSSKKLHFLSKNTWSERAEAVEGIMAEKNE